jgi:hypothetical protein
MTPAELSRQASPPSVPFRSGESDDYDMHITAHTDLDEQLMPAVDAA